MFKLHVIINVNLCVLPLLQLEEQMILQHLKNTVQSGGSKVASQNVCYRWQYKCLLWDFTNSIFRFGKDEPAKDAFNFYLSQLRIHIEQKFGIMTTKWRILCQPLQVHLKHVGKIFMCITRLHNFWINEGCVCIINLEDNLQNETGYIPSDITETSISENSVLWDIIVQELAQRALERTTFN